MIGTGSQVHPSAKLLGPVIIGANCSVGSGAKIIGPAVIGPGCTIMEDSIIIDSVIWPETWVGPRVNVKHSIIADHCHLDSDSVIDESVLGCNVTVCGGHRLPPGSKVMSGSTA